MKLQEGKIYRIKHEEKQITRQHQSGFIVASRMIDRSGEYEYIGKMGNKFHFYNQNSGHDIYLSKSEYEEKIY